MISDHAQIAKEQILRIRLFHRFRIPENKFKIRFPLIKWCIL